MLEPGGRWARLGVDALQAREAHGGREQPAVQTELQPPPEREEGARPTPFQLKQAVPVENSLKLMQHKLASARCLRHEISSPLYCVGWFHAL